MVFRQGGVGAGAGMASPAITGTGTMAHMILVLQVQIPGRARRCRQHAGGNSRREDKADDL
jgi:hypothetical protein